MIYLDEAATTKPKEEVINAMLPFFTDMWFNPSSLYGGAVEVARALEVSKYTISNSINAKCNEIYFTSGGSESNCWAIQGFVNYWKSRGKESVVITSTIEHHSIIECVENIDADFMFISVDKNGFINPRHLEQMLKQCRERFGCCKIIVSLQYANNEIGTIQNISELISISHKYGAVFHTDAVQAFGHINIDVNELNVDMLSVSGHKIGCPKGIGFLYIKNGIKINPIIYGTQNNGLRGGTENVPYIIGLSKAVSLIDDSKTVKIKKIRDYAIDKLIDTFHVTLNGDKECRLPNNINVSFPYNVTGESLIYLLDMCDVYVSSGSACNSHIDKPSHVLKAIGLSDEDARRSLRITLSEETTKEDIDKAIYEIDKQIKILESE